MKLEEAIFWIEDTKYIYENMNPDMELSKLKCEAFNLAIQALEKQVPKKPRIINGGTNTCDDTDCCNDVLRWYSYCPVCGQAIDWSKSE